VLGASADRAREQMLAASFWQARFAVLDRSLLARLRATDARRRRPRSSSLAAAADVGRRRSVSTPSP
jgi:hypothetical protein